MPAAEQQITDLHDELNALAALVETDSVALIEIIAAIEEADEQTETLRADAMIAVANLRSPEGNKLIYTNDDQRKSKLITTLAANADYQAFQTAKSTLAVASATRKAAIEKNRHLHQAKLAGIAVLRQFPVIFSDRVRSKEKLRQPFKAVGVKRQRLR